MLTARGLEAVHLEEEWRKQIFPKGNKTSEPLVLDRDELMERGFGATEQERPASFGQLAVLLPCMPKGARVKKYLMPLNAAKLMARVALAFCWFNTKDGVPMGGTTKGNGSRYLLAAGAHKQKPDVLRALWRLWGQTAYKNYAPMNASIHPVSA